MTQSSLNLSTPVDSRAINQELGNKNEFLGKGTRRKTGFGVLYSTNGQNNPSEQIFSFFSLTRLEEWKSKTPKIIQKADGI